jgi:1-phosphofructokinase family hexose kinase
MILCLTPNPAIDRTLVIPSLVPGDVHRSQQTIVAAGGKGLNVARTIRTLGGKPLCMGFAGGHSGRLLADLAQDEGLHSHWTWTETETRTCTILVAQDGEATVINEPGMPVSASDWKRLKEDARSHLPSVGLVCISGSLPPAFSAEEFQDLLSMLVEAGKQVWVDTSGPALHTALAHHGISIKVNGNEIGEILGLDIKDFDSGKRALAMLQERGVTNAVITLGSLGALLIAQEGRMWQAGGPPVRVVSSVGSGDAFLGGLASALDAGRSWPESLGHAVAAGTANTLSAGGGQFTLQEFDDIRAQVTIRNW